MENINKTAILHQNTIEKLEKQLEFTQNKLEKAKELLTEVFIENKELKKRLAQYEKPIDEYKNDWSWVSKIVYLVKQANKPIRSAEIIIQLSLREQVLDTKRSKAQFVSAFLNIAVQYERLMQYKLKGVRGYYYCLPEWIDEEKELLQEMRRKIF